jgi:hypothetical protein
MISTADLAAMPETWPHYAPAQFILNLVNEGHDIELPPICTNGTVIKVNEYQVDFNDPAACTEIRLRHIVKSGEQGWHYLNPQFTVSADNIQEPFCDKMWGCSRRWFQRLDKQFHTRGRKHVYKSATLKEKTLGYSGVLVIDGDTKRGDGILRTLANVRRKEERKMLKLRTLT